MGAEGQPVEFAAAYWRSLCPGCSVPGAEAAANVADPPRLELPKPFLAGLRARMDMDGYFDVAAAPLLAAHPRYGELIRRLEVAVRRLVGAGWPASFIVVYDEAWELVELLSPIVRRATGGNECMMDLVAWHIDPDEDEAGFTPHRDRHLGLEDANTDAVAAGFRKSDGRSPRDSTCWIALSKAVPDNGCLYMLPRGADPAYALGDCSAAAGGRRWAQPPKPATFALEVGPLGCPVYAPSSAAAWQHVRCVPCDEPGSLVCFSHRIIHWGSQGRPGSVHGPRISLSFAASDHSYQVAEPYFDAAELPYPSLERRLCLASAQMLCYAGNGRFTLSYAEIIEYRRAFRRGRRGFAKQYRATVKQAARAALARATAPPLASAVAAQESRKLVGGVDEQRTKERKRRKRRRQHCEDQQL